MAISDENTQALQALTEAIERLTQVTQQQANPRAGTARDPSAGRRSLLSKKGKVGGGGAALAAAGGGRGLTGGVAGLLGGLGGPIGTALKLAPVAGVAQSIGAGITNRSRGGTFAAGATAGAVDFLGSVPIFGEVSGFRQARDIQRNALGRLNSMTNELAALGANFNNPEGKRIKNFLADVAQQRAIRFTEDQRQNQVAINARVGRAATAAGGAAAESVEWLKRILDVLERGLGGIPNPGGLF